VGQPGRQERPLTGVVDVISLEILLDARGDSPPFWLTVRHNQVVEIAEQ
jgi:hypothetical protein